MNTMHVEDFVVLGRTVPEESRKFGQRICMAGFSRINNQFLRVYPLMVPVGAAADKNGFRARYTYTLDLRRNDNDSRTESWRLADDQRPTPTPWDRAVECPKARLLEWLEDRCVPSIRTLNDCRMSLGVLRLNATQRECVCIERGAANQTEHHASLFDDLEVQAAEVPSSLLVDRIRHAPYFRFEDAGGAHQLQVREWGAYMLLAQEKYADNPDTLWSANGYRRDRDLFVVVGNMNNHRNNWLIIKTFEISPETPGLFDSAQGADLPD
jgi:hypothetical protein